MAEVASRLNDLGRRGGEVVLLNPKDIIIQRGFNYRDMESEAVAKHIDWLKGNIREHGVQEPIRVKFEGGKVFLINGECRLLACKALRKEGVEVFIPAVTARGDEAEVLAKSMVANGALPPTQLEFGAAAARLKKYGWDDDRIALFTPPHIAQNPSKARRYVREAVELHEAPIAVKEAVKEGVNGIPVSPALALQAARKNPLHAREEIEKIATEAKAAGKSVAKRPKGAGPATKAKAAKETYQESLERIGDRMATLILDDPEPAGVLKSAALAWNQTRGR